MADLLKFKKGLRSALDSAVKEAGTVYITTDEQAMYVDISAEKRIRVGQIVNFETYAAFKQMLTETAPPYDIEAFYYIADKNALLRWKADSTVNIGDDKPITGKWIQVNSVSDVQASIDDVKKDLASVTADVASLKTTVGDDNSGLVSDVNKLKTDVVTAQTTADKGVTDAAAAQKTADEAKSAAESNANAIATANANIATNTSNITKNAGDISDLQARTEALETTVGGAESGLVKDVADLKNAVGDSTKGLVKDVADLKAKDAELQAQVTTNANNIKTNADEIAALKEAIGTDGSTGNSLADRMTAVEEVAAAAKAQSETNKTDIGTNSSNIAKNATDIANLTKTVSDNATTAKSYTDEQIKTVTNAVNSLSSDLDTTKESLGKTQTELATVKDDLANAKSDLNSKIDDAKADLSAEIDKDIQAANAMTYMGEVNESSALPTTGVHIGDTYVVSVKGTYNGIACYAGDMFIAKSSDNTEKDDGTIDDSKLQWKHVESGYVKDYDDKLVVTSNTISLNNHIGDSNGAVHFNSVADGEAGVKVELTNAGGAATSEATISIQWGSF